MPRVILTKGLPASGKDTWAMELMTKSPGRYRRVNKDDIRAMLAPGEDWSWELEKLTLQVRDKIILAELKAGYDVLVTDTNLNPKMERGIRALVGHRATVEVKFFDVDVETCVTRNKKRRETDPGHVRVPSVAIYKMAKDWQKWQYVDCSVEQTVNEVYEWTLGLPTAVIVDLDGTLAHMHNRSPYEWQKVGDDTLDDAVATVVHALHDQSIEIIVLSGRDAECREITELWLELHEIPYSDLFMRPEGDGRKDSIVKREIFNKDVRPNYNVLAVLDDRNQVVDEWRAMGLKCFQVDDGDF